MNENGYIPGQCNLGEKEIKRRKIQTIAGLIITILFVVTFRIYHFPSMWKLAIFAPVFYTIIGFLQARENFCVVFGITGVYNFNDERKLVKVKDDDSVLKDRKKAMKMLVISVFIAVVITVMYFYWL